MAGTSERSHQRQKAQPNFVLAAQMLRFRKNRINWEIFEVCPSIPIGPFGNSRAGLSLCGHRLGEPERCVIESFHQPIDRRS
jgi:hypothetical protein